MTKGQQAMPRAAGNGLLDRRLLLKSLAFGTMTAAAGTAAAQAVREGQPEWMLAPGATTDGYGGRSRFEVERSRRFTVPEAGWGSTGRSVAAFTPHHLTHGTITPSGLHFEVNHHGIPDIDPDRHELVIHGMVERPMKYRLEQLENLPTETHNYFLECAGNSGRLWAPEPAQATLDLTHGLLSGSEWTGVPVATLLDRSGLSAGASWLIVEGADAGSVYRSVPLDAALRDSMVALYQNGERLRPGQGYPMRLLNPGFEGNTNIKWLRSIRVTDRPAMARFETSTYSDLMPDGKALQFTLPMEVKSVITRPSNANALPQPGIYEVTGLAWSGEGRITRVDVSADGGRTWAEAALQEPVQPKMLTRFRIPWEWNGGPATLQSRAIDETGRVQPTREELIAARGRNARYHFNGIHSWGVAEDGSVSHVYA
ncbi:MAG: sulfite dehydrogenase [Woeseiaceae bacterium]|nr:sulfite dehydrogenase [Woeseiaceae bacterium]